MFTNFVMGLVVIGIVIGLVYYLIDSYQMMRSESELEFDDPTVAYVFTAAWI